MSPLANVNDYNLDAVIACVDLCARAAAKQFEVGYLDDTKASADARWYAEAYYKGARVIADEHRGPAEACDALAAKLISGGSCAKCTKTVITYEPTLRYERRHRCRWMRIGVTWCAGCDPDPRQNKPTGERERNDMRPK